MEDESIFNVVKKSIFGAGLGLILVGCKPSNTIEMKNITASNYSITRVAVFEDDLAYNGRRGVYEITDSNTGKMYLGISGIGISEIGSHPAGKSTHGDER